MNIEEYEFTDSEISKVTRYRLGKMVEIATKRQAHGTIELRKSDVIALAKHFKLTLDDIKDK